jgi:hypothetical protein
MLDHIEERVWAIPRIESAGDLDYANIAILSADYFCGSSHHSEYLDYKVGAAPVPGESRIERMRPLNARIGAKAFSERD